MKRFITVLTTTILLLVAVVLLRGVKTTAACTANGANLGVATGSFTVPAAGTYRVWSRIRPSSTSTSNNSYTLEVDSGTVAAGSATCNITVGDATLPANTWTWVDYRDGNAASKIAMTLSAGTHTYSLYGRESGVGIDRVVFSADASCVPTGNGDNCANTSFPPTPPPADTVKPSVSITAPAANATISGNAYNIQATASDNVAVQSVMFYMDGVLLGTDTQSPYTFTLNTTLYTNGSHTLTAIATDTSSTPNTQTSSPVQVTITNTVPDTTKPSVVITAPLQNSTISGTYAVSATVTDAGGVAHVDFSVDGGPVKLNDTTSPYVYNLDTTTLSNGTHSITVTAYDVANNSQAATVSVTVNNTATPPPTTKKADFNNDNKVDVSDLVILLGNFNKTVTTNTKGDCNGDTKVDIQDLVIMLGLYGK